MSTYVANHKLSEVFHGQLILYKFLFMSILAISWDVFSCLLYSLLCEKKTIEPIDKIVKEINLQTYVTSSNT